MRTIDQVNSARIARGWTWKRLAEATGIAQSRYSKWFKRNQGEPSATQIRDIARALGRHPSELIGETSAVPAGGDWRGELYNAIGDAVIRLGSAAKRLERAATALERRVHAEAEGGGRAQPPGPAKASASELPAPAIIETRRPTR